jgi:hypothetical protein
MKRPIVLLLGFVLGISLFLAGCEGESSPANGNETKTASSDAPKQPVPDSLLMAKGVEISTAAFDKLSGALKRAMTDSGVAGAVPYCNLMAWPLLDTLARSHGVKISRTALRYRNPSNQPAAGEAVVLNRFAAQIEAGEPASPILERQEGQSPVFYRPILLKEGCLPCHGVPGKDIAEENLKIIRGLYPNDQAVDFRTGDLRGMWVVENLEQAMAETPGK